MTYLRFAILLSPLLLFGCVTEPHTETPAPSNIKSLSHSARLYAMAVPVPAIPPLVTRPESPKPNTSTSRSFSILEATAFAEPICTNRWGRVVPCNPPPNNFHGNIVISWSYPTTTSNIVFNVYATNNINAPLKSWPRVATTPNLFWTDHVMLGVLRFYAVKAMDATWGIESEFATK